MAASSTSDGSCDGLSKEAAKLVTALALHVQNTFDTVSRTHILFPLVKKPTSDGAVTITSKDLEFHEEFLAMALQALEGCMELEMLMQAIHTVDKSVDFVLSGGSPSEKVSEWAVGEATVLHAMLNHLKRLCRNSESRSPALKRLKSAYFQAGSDSSDSDSVLSSPEEEVLASYIDLVRREWPELDEKRTQDRARRLLSGKPLDLKDLEKGFNTDFLGGPLQVDSESDVAEPSQVDSESDDDALLKPAFIDRLLAASQSHQDALNGKMKVKAKHQSEDGSPGRPDMRSDGGKDEDENDIEDGSPDKGKAKDGKGKRDKKNAKAKAASPKRDKKKKEGQGVGR